MFDAFKKSFDSASLKTFLESHIQITDKSGSKGEESTKLATEWKKKFVEQLLNQNPSSQFPSFLFYHIDITLSRNEDGPIYISDIRMKPVLNHGPPKYALLNSGIAVLSGLGHNQQNHPSCNHEKYSKSLLTFILGHSKAVSNIVELPDPLEISNRDVLNFGSHLTIIGSTYYTSEETIRYLMNHKLITSNRVAVVRDLFDRNISERPNLDSILFFPSSETVAVSESIVGGISNPKRRIVQEYSYDEKKGKYELRINDMELIDYLKFIGFTSPLVVPVSNSNKSSISLLHLGNGELASPCPELANFYNSKNFKTKTIDNLTSDCIFNRMVVIRQPSTSSSNVFSNIKSSEDVPYINQPVCGYKDSKQRQTSNNLLMVAPIGFLSNAQTALDNYFMNTTTLPEYEVERKALAEYSDFHRALVSEGVRIFLCKNERFFEAPDAVFPNNWFSTHCSGEDSSTPQANLKKSTFCLYPMKAPARRAERREHIINLLAPQYDQQFHLTQYEYQGANGAAFEGTGSLVLDRVNKVAYCALSQRADELIFNSWCDKMGYTPCTFTAVDLQGRAVYHTNVVMGIGSSVAVICSQSIPDSATRLNVMKTLSKHHTVVDITLEQMNSFCGNILEVEGAHEARLLVMSTRAYKAFTKAQIETFERHTKKIVHVPVPTIEDIGGGGVRCMMAEIF